MAAEGTAGTGLADEHEKISETRFGSGLGNYGKEPEPRVMDLPDEFGAIAAFTGDTDASGGDARKGMQISPKDFRNLVGKFFHNEGQAGRRAVLAWMQQLLGSDKRTFTVYVPDPNKAGEAVEFVLDFVSQQFTAARVSTPPVMQYAICYKQDDEMAH